MLVGLDDDPEVVALLPTLGRDVGRLRHSVDSVVASQVPFRFALRLIVNSPQSLPDDVGLPSDVDVLDVGMNLGWSGGLHFASEGLSSPFLWLVQDDMTVDPRCLALLHREAETTGAAIASPLSVDADGNVVAHSCGGVLDATGSVLRTVPDAPCRADELPELGSLSYVLSRGMLVRRSVWEAVGRMDPRLYPAMWADADLCFAVRTAGERFVLVPGASVRHKANTSTGSAFGGALYERNLRLIRAKWFGVGDPPLGGTVNARIAAHLLATTAQAAGDVVLDLGGRLNVATADRAARDEELAAYTAELESVWKERTDAVAWLREQWDQSIAERDAVAADRDAAAAERDAARLDRDALLVRLAQATQLLEAAQAESRSARRRVDELVASTSWRFTQPVRTVSALLARRRGR